MCNFFAQADALATGKTPVELRAENVPDSLIPHKTFTGNRPSTSLLLPELTAFTTGQILSLYENRIAVQARLPSPSAATAAWRPMECVGRRRRSSVCSGGKVLVARRLEQLVSLGPSVWPRGGTDYSALGPSCCLHQRWPAARPARAALHLAGAGASDGVSRCARALPQAPRGAERAADEALRGRRRASSGASTRSTSGAWSWARCWRARCARRCTPAAPRAATCCPRTASTRPPRACSTGAPRAAAGRHGRRAASIPAAVAVARAARCAWLFAFARRPATDAAGRACMPAMSASAPHASGRRNALRRGVPLRPARA